MFGVCIDCVCYDSQLCFVLLDSSSNLPNGKLKSSDKAAQQLESLSGPEDDGLMQPSTPQPGSDDWEYVDTPVNQVC